MVDERTGSSYGPGGYLALVFKGFCMGTADVIPGVSGGTIAFLLGIYEELIDAIKSFDLKFIQLIFRLRFKEAFLRAHWPFLAAVLSGIISAVLVFSRIISWLLTHQPVLLFSFFFGLILATAPVIGRVIKRWTPAEAASVAVSAAVTYYLVGLVPLSTPDSLWFLFLCGAVAISAMILPGISGAFILVLLGKYQFVLDAVNQRDLVSLGVFICGVAAGIVTFVRVLSWLFHRYHDLTVTVITGVVIGSLRKVWPWKETISSIVTGHGKVVPIEEANYWPARFDGEVLTALLVMAAGFVLAILLNSNSDGKLLSRH